MGAPLLILCSLGLALGQNPETPAALARFLRQNIRLDSAQLAAAERGEVVVKLLDAPDRRDVAVFGMVVANVARAAYVTRVRDFRTSLRAPTRTHFGIFSTPAVPADVAAVTISAQDVDEMKDCRPGDCKVKLPATDMRRIQAETNWTAPDRQAQLSAYARRRLVEYIADYRARGDSAMALYDDRGNATVHASAALAALLAESPWVYQNVPSLERYLASYPHGSLPGAAEVLYWAEDAVPHLRPILSVTHQVVYTPAELPDLTLIAAKQIYADHYFEAAFDLTCIVDRPGGAGAPAGGSYVLALRRYRFDNLPSGGLLNIRGRAIGALRDQLQADLRRLKETAEQSSAR